MAKAHLITSDGRDWYELYGTDYGTGYKFNGTLWGVTKNNTILDYEGYPQNETDIVTIAVRNTLKITNGLTK